MEVCYYSDWKPLEDYRDITDSTSPQYQFMYTNGSNQFVIQDGLLIFDNEYIGVALGSRYGAIGTKYKITTDTGKEFKVVKIDEKSDEHTSNGCQDSSGAIIEFVVDTETMSNEVMFHGTYNADEQFNGVIIKMEKIK
ncbi:hypothetical protein LJC02_02930 [Breznakia sp. OttesenSCG-928-G09]|nr:hypothetical protein [Breznakia sp. OttesenSCG-928-G09]